MLCPQCGKYNNDGAKFCTGCGSALFSAEPPVQEDIYRGTQPDPGYYDTQEESAGQEYETPETDDSYWDDEPGETAQGGTYDGVAARTTEASDRLKGKRGAVSEWKNSKWANYAAAGFALLMAALFLLCSVYAKANSPERLAERFFVALANGRYSKAFSYFDIKQTEFANPTALKQAASYYDLSQVSSYEAEGSGGTVIIRYKNKGSDEEYTMSIPLETDEKGRGWKVSSDPYFTQDAQIIVPSGASCTVDDVPLTDSYASANEDDYYGDVTVYTIPQIGRGSHIVKVKAEGRAETARSWDASGSMTLTDLAYSNETLTYLQQLAVYNMSQIYNAALKGQDFSTIESLFSADEYTRERVREDYEYMVERLEGSDYQVSKLTFAEIRANGNNYSSSVYLQFSYQAAYTARDWSGNVVNEEIQNTYSSTFDFVQENGNWVQTSLGCSSLGF